jgi:drug/metabolite transporter (DMT)-like permease
MQDKARGTVEMTSAMLISGTIGWFVVRSGQSVMDVVLWRCVFGAATLLLICAARGFLRRDVITLRQLALAALGGVAIVLNWLLLFASYAHASISIATVIYNTQPFMLLALGALFLGERLTAPKLSWLTLAFVGMLLIVQAKPDVGYVGSNYFAGILMALGAAACYAAAAMLTKLLRGVPPHFIALVHVSVGVAMLALLGSPAALPADATTWAILVAVGVVHTGLMYIFLYGAIQKLPTHLIGALSFIYPIVAIAVDLLGFGHRLHVSQLVGAAAILLSAASMTLGWTLRIRKQGAKDPQGRNEPARGQSSE